MDSRAICFLRSTAFAFGAAALLALTGCTGDASLRVAPELPPDDGAGDGDVTTGLPNDGGDGVGGGGGLSSPWGSLDPGDLPDTVFAVAWVDLTEGCVNCYYAQNAPDRYDIIDPLGQVISSFELPFEWQESYPYPPPLRSLDALGPGRFVASNLLYGPAEESQVVWEGDAYTGESRVLARIYRQRIELPQTGELIFLSEPNWTWEMQVIPDPAREGALLILPTNASPYVSTTLREIISVPYDDPALPVRRWPVSEFAPHLLNEGWDGLEPAALARIADDGSGRLVLGLHRWDTDADGLTQRNVELASFAPTDDLDIQRDVLPEGELHPASRILPGDEDSGPIVLSQTYDCESPFTWSQDGEVVEFPMSEGDWCPTLGPLLDVDSRTFMYSAWYGDEDYSEAQRVVVSVAGEEVWSIDRFQRGLSQRPFHLLGAVALER